MGSQTGQFFSVYRVDGNYGCWLWFCIKIEHHIPTVLHLGLTTFAQVLHYDHTGTQVYIQYCCVRRMHIFRSKIATIEHCLLWFDSIRIKLYCVIITIKHHTFVWPLSRTINLKVSFVKHTKFKHVHYISKHCWVQHM